MRRQVIAAAVAAIAFVAGQGTASAASYYGNPAGAAPYWAPQTANDCVEQSSRLAMDELAGRAVVAPAAIDREAYKLGLTSATFDGTSWNGDTETLFTHYGFKAAGPVTMGRKRLEGDLAHGKAVVALVNADLIWNSFGFRSNNWTDLFDANHAVLVEAVDKQTGAVTLGDTGVPVGNGEVVSWAVFSRAWGTGDYSAIVVRR